MRGLTGEHTAATRDLEQALDEFRALGAQANEIWA
jgi:hypothetical protein